MNPASTHTVGLSNTQGAARTDEVIFSMIRGLRRYAWDFMKGALVLFIVAYFLLNSQCRQAVFFGKPLSPICKLVVKMQPTASDSSAVFANR